MMDKGFSIWLDLLRGLAALAVLFGHMAHVRFTGGEYYLLRELNIASDAVVVFFVISGIVIAYAASRDATPGRYAFHRVTRLLSVILPALLLTLLLDAIGTRLDESAYPSPYYQPAPLSDFLLRGLTLSTEWTGLMDRVRLGTNGPLWSLSYEVAYYLLFGIALFARGLVRFGLLGLVALVVGLPVLLLLPAWLIGVLVWRHVSASAIPPQTPLLGVGLAVVPLAVLVIARALGVPELLSGLTAQALAPASHHDVLGYSDELAWNMLIALAIALHLAGVAHLCRGREISEHAAPVRIIRWFASASFSIYAIHYPVLHFFDALLPADLPGHNAVMLASTLSVCFVFAWVFERRIGQMRRALVNATALFQRPATAP